MSPFFYVQLRSPDTQHICCAVVFLVPPPGSFPQFLPILTALAPEAFLPLTLHRSTSHPASTYEVHFTTFLPSFLLSPFLPLKLKSTKMYDHSTNSFTSHPSTVPIPFFYNSLLATESYISKKALLCCSMLLLITPALTYFATPLTCHFSISFNDYNY